MLDICWRPAIWNEYIFVLRYNYEIISKMMNIEVSKDLYLKFSTDFNVCWNQGYGIPELLK